MLKVYFRPVWLNGWVFELSGCGFQSRWCHLIRALQDSQSCLVKVEALNRCVVFSISDIFDFKCSILIQNRAMLTLFRMGIFGAAHRKGGGAKRPPLPNICHTYPTMIKLGTVIPYLKEIQKLYESRDTTPDFCWHQHFFHWKSANFVISRKTDIDCILVHNFNFFLAFLKSLKIFLINLIIILMMSAKMATPGLLKITVFWNKGYDVIISVDEVTNKILSRGSNYIVDAFM